MLLLAAAEAEQQPMAFARQQTKTLTALRSMGLLKGFALQHKSIWPCSRL